jgi:PAS domain-containing protein
MKILLPLLNDYFFIAYTLAMILLIVLLALLIRGRILMERRTRTYIGRLKASEERYRLLADNARDVIWVFDLKLGYTYVSPSILKLRGFTVEEALKQSIEDILTPDSYQKMKAC